MSSRLIHEMYRKDDMLYHYTSLKSGLSILKEMKLRFNQRSNSNDPIENTAYFFTVTDYNGTGDNKGAMKLANEAKSILKYTKQLSFCVNKNTANEMGIISSTPYEKFGFMKPRMWEQYGNKYKGVCLAFSLENLKEEARKKGYFDNPVNYITYNDSEIYHRSIDANAIRTDGYMSYKTFFMNYLKQRLFNKHEDYIGENEYRFCSLSENDLDYLDISKSLKGIIISDHYMLTKQGRTFMNFVRKLSNVDSQIITFGNFVSIKELNLRFLFEKEIKKSIREERKKSTISP